MAESLAGWGFTASAAENAMVDDLLLIATELLSNAVKFSSDEVALALSVRRRAIRVSVTDSDPSPAAPRAAGLDASGGRGLAIVAALAKRWGQTPYVAGCKEVWAEVSVNPRSRARGGRSTATAVAAEG